ncbi:uncharacterized protein LOC116347032 [Contarinia nasturtii]|uniref:uncharacterized protein LOC116347032 n=1 Tax=Contarinia nasturtii TaxID=265458 RepID=UPI0012D46A1E|nr:uncharacterized protein LOC116347032 [Contarinia nasturtii]
MLEQINKFIEYWWFRYLMVTELYIVEKWERVTMHVILLILFLLVGYFNFSVVMPLVSKMIRPVFGWHAE